ncbi:MAG: universal stress protein [Desulfosporosinus sp.]|nr:universal stress protein [Desulfosporosinus sp.]
MTDLIKFKVLLYSDGTQQTLSAAVYAATLLKHMPNMHLTIVQIKESNEGYMGMEYSWKELRPKYKRYYWGCTPGTEPSSIDQWSIGPKTEWLNNMSNESDLEINAQDDEVLSKTQNIFLRRGINVKHQVLFSNTSISNTSDTADLILDYATRNSFGLIVMGEQEPSTLKWLNFGNLPHAVQNKSTLPVVVVKTLPQDFVDTYLLEKPKPPISSSSISHIMAGRSVNVLF